MEMFEGDNFQIIYVKHIISMDKACYSWFFGSNLYYKFGFWGTDILSMQRNIFLAALCVMRQCGRHYGAKLLYNFEQWFTIYEELGIHFSACYFCWAYYNKIKCDININIKQTNKEIALSFCKARLCTLGLFCFLLPWRQVAFRRVFPLLYIFIHTQMPMYRDIFTFYMNLQLFYRTFVCK